MDYIGKPVPDIYNRVRHNLIKTKPFIYQTNTDILVNEPPFP